MEYSIQNHNSQESEPEIEVIFDYSIEDEIERIEMTLKKYEWYQEKGYKLKFPELIQEKLDKGEEISKEDISNAVSSEFGSGDVNKKIKLLREKWNEIKEKFFEDLKILGLPLQSKYSVLITQYGTGGSYGSPNNIQLNIDHKKESYLILAHEIVHLTIEPLIKEYNIAHWVKERLVDLIMNKFFPENQRLQRDPENAEKISEIFEGNYPDIKKIIFQISQQ